MADKEGRSAYIRSLEDRRQTGDPGRHSGVKKKKNKKLLIAALVLCIAVIGVCIWQLVPPIIDDNASSEEYGEAADDFIETELPAEASSSSGTSQGEAAGPLYKIDFDALKQVNEDVCGWIVSDGTVINYPIVQADTNTYYLNRLYNKKKNRNGSIFLDHRNAEDFSDQNNVLYGHHMKSGAMFASIADYKQEGYYEQHPVMELYTPQKSYKVHIFSYYVTSSDDNYIQPSFVSDEEYAEFLRTIADRSLIKTGVSLTTADRILTLSTCTYDYTNARFVVHGKLEEF